MSKLAGALDVRDHRFGAGAPFTVGIEEEYMLLDPESFDLVPGAERILEAERDGVYAEHIAPELFDSLVEFHTRRVRDRRRGGSRVAAPAPSRGSRGPPPGASSRLRRHAPVQPLRASAGDVP